MSPPAITLGAGEAAVFGYGSLISRASLERTLQRVYDGPFVPCALDGWHRTWDVAMPNQGGFYATTRAGRLTPERILYLNVAPRSGARLNGVLFVVTGGELEALDKREWIYDRHRVTEQLRGVALRGGDAFLYVSKPEYLLKSPQSPAVAAVRATYIEILEAGLRDMGLEFRQAYEGSTDPVPDHLVIQDRRD